MTETLNDLYLSLRRRLRAAGIEASELEAREIVACAAHADKDRFSEWGYSFLAEQTVARAEALAARRLAGEPLAYLLGEWDFYGLTFQVTPAVLIPRPDTERLAELAIARAQRIVAPRVLDLCCGSGCIGIALLKHVEDARVTAADVSDEALAVTRENARRHSVTARHAAVYGDALQPPAERLGRFHLLVCNPPYITAQEMRELDDSVREHEPVLALYGGDDGLDFYRSVASQWQEALLPGGEVLFECGWKQAQQVAQVLRACGWKQVRIYQDYAGIERVVAACTPSEPIEPPLQPE